MEMTTGTNIRLDDFSGSAAEIARAGPANAAVAAKIESSRNRRRCNIEASRTAGVDYVIPPALGSNVQFNDFTAAHLAFHDGLMRGVEFEVQ